MKRILISLLILAIMIPAITACAAVPTSVAANGEFSVDSASSSQTVSQSTQHTQEVQEEQTEQTEQESDPVGSGSLN